MLQPGTKVDDYWDVGKAQLADPTKFLESLFKFDKDNIPEDAIKKIQPYIDNDDFQPAAIAKVCSCKTHRNHCDMLAFIYYQVKCIVVLSNRNSYMSTFSCRAYYEVKSW